MVDHAVPGLSSIAPSRRAARPRVGGRTRALLLGAVGNAVGLVLLVIAWVAVSNRGSLGGQLPWVDVGATGLLFAGAGDLAAVLDYRRLVRERIRAELLDRAEGTPR